MASNMLDTGDGSFKSAAGRDEKVMYEYDDYGNFSKKPFSYSKTFRSGGGDYHGYSSAGGYASDYSQRGYYQKHRSPYANAPRSRHGGDKYDAQVKTENHNWGEKKVSKGKEAESSKNAQGKHYASDISDMENTPLTDTEMFSNRQAAAEYGPMTQEGSRYGLMPTHNQEWNPRHAQGLCTEMVLTWNGSCTQFAEKKAAGTIDTSKPQPPQVPTL